MPFALLKYALSREHPDDPHFRWKPDLKKTYDVIIIGAGGHGLAAAYHLAKDYGITNIAVLEKGWLAGGNTARNTTHYQYHCHRHHHEYNAVATLAHPRIHYCTYMYLRYVSIGPRYDAVGQASVLHP